MKEYWKDIPGYKGDYQVSDLGRVRSLDRLAPFTTKYGKEATRFKKGQILKPQKHTVGYKMVRLSCRTPYLIHVLVLLAFKGKRPKGHESAHNDGDKTNNKLLNLRYDTRKGNHSDKIKHGTVLCGERNHNAKLTEADVLKIRLLYKHNLADELAKMFNVHPHTIQKIARGERWRYCL